MEAKGKLIKYGVIILSALTLGYINFKQGFQKIIIYMDDYDVILPKEAVFDRIFININFSMYEYMEGNSPFHYIGPFMFYLLAIFWGAYHFLLLKKGYYQFVFLRAHTKKEAFRFIKGSYIKNSIVFIFVYYVSIFGFIYTINSLEFLDVQTLLLKMIFLALTSVLLVIGLTQLMFCIYLKFNEVIALFVMFIGILCLFAINLNINGLSLVFIGEDPFFKSGITLGVLIIVVSKIMLRNAKYEIG
ncbi:MULTISPECIES: hypothetical protein [Lysinibacillus]|uniref:hypothetical protein n=1 Tax=Lysinibacillus TaxID=400634 RepID=UPI000562509A|nr:MULTISPECIES: hypothetical protein [Lysinibacillus]KUF29642.1 hypothetical protein AK833_18730 [Lysinibacillus sp. F5]MEE3809177.1 hypothetical protein [Lysinibacillus fusiformis]